MSHPDPVPISRARRDDSDMDRSAAGQGPIVAPASPREEAVGRGSLVHVAQVWFLAVVVIIGDQLTKMWAMATLADGHRVSLLGDLLGLVLVRNPGAAFSVATGQTWILSVVAIGVTVVVIRFSRRLGTVWWSLALGLVLGGAVGNLIDRLVRDPGVFRGHVVDFIDYGGFFVGNVADIAIVGAAGLIMVLSVMGVELDGSRPARNEADTTQSGEQTDRSEEAGTAEQGRDQG